jgi:LPS-assembly protein
LHAAVLALAAAAGLFAIGPAPAPTSRIEVVHADRIDYDVASDRVIVTGGVVLRRGAVTVRAASASYDERTGEVEASGGVLLTEPGRAVAASALHAVLDGPYQARDVVVFVKDAPLLDLSRCRTLDEARARGRNRLTLGGRVVDGESGADAFDVTGASVTVCDCGAGPPSWLIRSRSASVSPGHHAWLTLPVFYVTPRFLFWHHKLLGGPTTPKPVPVLALPVAYLPLGDRQSGLLLPTLAELGVNGWALDQPLYLTLGRSWDMTLSATWVFGPSAPHQLHGIKGPGGTGELRWAPAEGVYGRARFFLQHSVITDWPEGAARPPGSNRIALSLLHDQRLSDRAYFKAEAAVVDDPYYTQDFTADALLRNEPYRRSAVALTHRQSDIALEVDAAYLLPLQNLDACGGDQICRNDAGAVVSAPFGLFGSEVPVFHRLPSASLTLLPVRLGGPFRASAFAGVARFAPIRGPTGDEGANGIGPGEKGWSRGAIDEGEADGRWERGERLAAARALSRVEVRAPFSLGRLLTVEPWLAGTAAAYAFEASASPQVDARLAGGLTLSSSLSRSYGKKTRLRHVVEPSVAWRAGTGEAGPGLPTYAYDEMDVARLFFGPVDGSVVPQRTLSAIPGAFSQLRLALRNRLELTSGRRELASLDLSAGQDVDLAGGGRLAETWVQMGLHLGLASGWTLAGSGSARFFGFGASRPQGYVEPEALRSGILDTFSQLGAGVALSDARGDSIHSDLTAYGPGGSPQVLAGLEPFFDLRALPFGPSAGGSVGVSARLGAAALGYTAYYYPRTTPVCGHSAPRIYQHGGSIVWNSECNCWKLGLEAVLNECDAAPRFLLVIDVSSLAERRFSF